jgi:hypothetical protein
MHSKNHFLCNCPHLGGSSYGAICNASNTLIKNIEDANISICMSRHFESCYIYFNSLRSAVITDMADVVIENRI